MRQVELSERSPSLGLGACGEDPYLFIYLSINYLPASAFLTKANVVFTSTNRYHRHRFGPSIRREPRRVHGIEKSANELADQSITRHHQLITDGHDALVIVEELQACTDTVPLVGGCKLWPKLTPPFFTCALQLQRLD